MTAGWCPTVQWIRCATLAHAHGLLNELQWNLSKVATIGTKDFVRYKGVSLIQGSYKPHPLKWSLGSHRNLAEIWL